MDSDELVQLRLAKRKLDSAISNGRSPKWCLTLWGRFVRLRDAGRCVMCKSTRGIEAHHIWRKVTYPKGRLELGNGITLCSECHTEPHAKFNRRPDLQQPFDAEGGDDQDLMAAMWSALERDADHRGLNHEEFYYIRDEMLQFFVGVQGYEHLYWAVQRGDLSRLRMAREIWQDMPEVFYENFFSELIRLNLGDHRSSQASSLSWPDDADGDVLRQLQVGGFDFFKPTLIDFHVDFQNWPPPPAAVELISRQYPSLTVYEPEGEDDGYLQFQVHALVTYELVTNIQSEVTELLAPFEGECSSWGVLVTHPSSR